MIFVSGGDSGIIEHVKSDGTFVEFIESVDDLGNPVKTNGITFSNTGHMYTAVGPVDVSVFPYAWDVVYIPDGSGLLSVVATSDTTAELWRVGLDGTKGQTYSIEVDADFNKNPMKVDIECDSRTVYYTDSSFTIFKYDIGTPAGAQ